MQSLILLHKGMDGSVQLNLNKPLTNSMKIMGNLSGSCKGDRL